MDAHEQGQEHVLGILADPGAPTALGRWLETSERLAEQLAEETGRRWRVEVVSRSLPTDEKGRIPVPEIAREPIREHGWDCVVLVTDLPRREKWTPLIANYSTEVRAGMVSVPALGALFTRRRALDAISHLVVQHIGPTAEGTGTESQDADSEGGDGEHDNAVAGVGPSAGGMQASHDRIDEHIALLGIRGRVRLLAGMVRANRPWVMVPSLSPAIAGAAAGAAFGIFYSNIWMLADAFGLLRMVVVGVLAVLAMIVWLIVDNGLWERHSDVGSREQAMIANTATMITISIAVACMYLLLFAATLVAAGAVIPPAEMQRMLGHPVSFGDYASLAWLAASMGTIAGALGSGLADEEMVRQAAYSRRELQRRQREGREAADHI